MRGWMANAANVVLVVCAVAVTALVVRREVGSPRGDEPAGGELVTDWRTIAEEGHLIGEPDAPVTVVVFSDFQCPACASFAETLHRLQQRHPGRVAAVYRHFPLPNHAFAVPAARASECAARQGRFAEMHDELFGAQDSIGVRSWARFATLAGIPDGIAFETCLGDPASAVPVRRDADAAGRLRVTATPTLLVNGRRVQGAPHLDRLERLMDEALRDGSR
jgi:protein-disulfide isomerase